MPLFRLLYPASSFAFTGCFAKLTRNFMMKRSQKNESLAILFRNRKGSGSLFLQEPIKAINYKLDFEISTKIQFVFKKLKASYMLINFSFNRNVVLLQIFDI